MTECTWCSIPGFRCLLAENAIRQGYDKPEACQRAARRARRKESR